MFVRRPSRLPWKKKTKCKKLFLSRNAFYNVVGHLLLQPQPVIGRHKPFQRTYIDGHYWTQRITSQPILGITTAAFALNTGPAPKNRGRISAFDQKWWDRSVQVETRSSYPLRYEPITKGWAHNLFGCDLNRPSAEPLPCSSWAGKGLHVNNGGHAVHMKHENACSLDSMLYPTFGIWIELLPPRKTTDSQWVIKWMNEWIIMSVVFTITIISCVCFALKHYDELTPLL